MNDLTLKKGIDLDLLNTGYNSEIKQYMSFSGGNVTSQSIKGYMEKLNRENASASKYNKNLYAIKDLIKKAVLNDPRLNNLQRYEIERFFHEIKGKKRGKGERAISKEKTLSPADTEKLLNNCTDKLKFIVRFLLKTGLRVSELCSITLANCKEVDNVVFIKVMGKGDKERTIRINKSFYDEIWGYFKGSKFLFETPAIVKKSEKDKRKGHQPLNPRNIDKELRRQSQKILNRAISPHVLRHTFATMAIKETGKIKAVSEYLGHSTTAITQDMYNHETLEQTELFDFMDQF